MSSTLNRLWITTSALIGMLLLSTSCSRNEASFLVETFVEMTVPAGFSADRILTLRQEVPFPLELALDANNVNEGDLVGIHGSLGFVSPRILVDSDLNFINEIEIDVLDPEDNTFGREIFHYVQRDFNRRTSIDLTPSLPNVQDFVRDDIIFLQIELAFNTPPPANFNLFFQLQLGVFEEEP